MKLLIVENDVEFGQTIKKYFKKRGHVCESANTYKTGLQKIISHDYDGILLQLYISGGNGLKLLKVLQNNHSEAGVVLISSVDSLDDRLRGFEGGVDDFMTRPFHLAELYARFKALIRRKAYRSGRQLAFDDFVIDLDARQLKISDKLVALTKKEFEILLLLVRNKNRVVTKESIADHTWGDYMDNIESFAFIYAHVKNLRKKLESAGCSDYLTTVYGVGYRFSVG